MLDLVAISDRLCVLLSLLTMNAELREYRKLFQQMIQDNDPGIINNSSRAHAKVILQELIRSAQKEILIQCSHLARDIYGDKTTQQLLSEAISRGVTVSIAIRDACPDAANFCADLMRQFPASIHCNTTVFPSDFCVVDTLRFRLETDQDNGKAYVCANNTEISTRLREIYTSTVAA